MTAKLHSWKARLASGGTAEEAKSKTKDGAPKKVAERGGGKVEREETRSLAEESLVERKV